MSNCIFKIEKAEKEGELMKSMIETMREEEIREEMKRD